MANPTAVNDAGDVVVFDGQQWKPAPMAANDHGEKVFFDGEAWKPLGNPAEAKGKAAVTGPNDAVNAFGNAVGQGGTLGLADELGATVRAALPSFSNMAMAPSALKRDESIGGGNEPAPQTVSTAPTFGARYDEELARIRAQSAADKEAHPYATGAGQLVGNLAATAPLMAAMPSVAGSKMLGNALKFGAAGGGVGAAQGFAEGQGGFLNRAANAGSEGAFGAGLGAAVPVAGTLVRRGIESGPGRAIAEKVISPVLTAGADLLPESSKLAALLRGSSEATGNVAEHAAVGRIAEAADVAKMTPQQIAERLRALGPESIPADLGGQFRSLALGTKVLPGETRDLAQEVLTARHAGTGQRMEQAITGGQDVPSMTRAQQYLGAHQGQTGADLYGNMRQAGLNVSPEMQSMQQIPAVRTALMQIEQDAANTGTTLNPVDVMHRVKQKLNDTAEAAFRSGTPVNKTDVGSLASQWERAFWEANPQARAADTGYAQAMGLSNPNTHEGALQQGRRFMQAGMSDQAQAVSPDALFDRFAQGNPQAKSIFQVGATNAMRDEARQGTPGALRLATKLGADYPDLANKIEQIYGPARAAEMRQAATSNRTFAETKNSLLGGSQTAEKLGDAAEVGNTRFNITPTGIRERATEHLRNIVGKIESPNEAVLNKIGEMMIQPKDKERLIELLMKASNRRAGTRLPAGAVAAGASSIGGNP